MKNKLFLGISLLLIVGGAVIGWFAGYTEVQLAGFALSMFGAGLLCNQLWKEKKAEAKKPLIILSLVFIGAGSFFAGVMGIMSEEKLKALIGLVFAFILLVAGIITNYVANRNPAKTE